ncbi:hypothetical protein, partial [Pseudomonas coronafaciens]|uniref:hypothetical protein n=1 Tax=Pseudomonas coronafaciens TaxID=53409 RepID=UPI001C7E8E57
GGGGAYIKSDILCPSEKGPTLSDQQKPCKKDKHKDVSYKTKLQVSQSKQKANKWLPANCCR